MRDAKSTFTTSLVRREEIAKGNRLLPSGFGVDGPLSASPIPKTLTGVVTNNSSDFRLVFNNTDQFNTATILFLGGTTRWASSFGVPGTENLGEVRGGAFPCPRM